MNETPSNKKLLLQYAGLTMQLLVMLAICIVAGKWLDDVLHFSIPLLVWVLPLFAVIVIIWKAIKDTSNKNK